MKTYPSIPKTISKISNCYIFDKLDGSNIRIEWSAKRGFFKFGRRNGLLDNSNPILYNEVIPTFDALREDYSKLLTDLKWKNSVLFFEFWGENSFAGNHVAGEPKCLTLIDATSDKKGMLSPKEFIKTFADSVETAKFLGRMTWNKELIERVRVQSLEGITFEGVVGKSGNKQGRITMSKAKTQAWKDKVIGLYGGDLGRKIVES